MIPKSDRRFSDRDHASIRDVMLGFTNKSPDHFAALDRVRAWTRARFSLPDEVVITVAEVACAVPGCPPLETVIAFWTTPDRRHHLKVFKPVAEVLEDD